MKLSNNINGILEQEYYFVKILDPIDLYNSNYSTIINRRKYERALKLIETERTEIQKGEAIQIINKTINNMKDKCIPLLIDNLIFAIAYPESYDLITPYYNTLYETCLNSKKYTGIYNGQIGIFKNNKAEIKNKINILKESTATLFSPLLETKELAKIQKELDINNDEIKKILNAYKKIKTFTNQTFSNTDIANRIKLDILNESTLENISKQYHISREKIDKILQTELNEMDYKEILDRLRFNSANRYNSIKNTITTLMELISDGINITEEKNIKFTMLDYYFITSKKPKEIMENLKLLNTTSKEEILKKSKLKNFLLANNNQGPNVNLEYFIRNKIIITNANVKFDMLDYFDQIHEEFEKKNIPSYSKLYETALIRISKNQPIIPLKVKEEVNEQNKTI